MNKPEIVGVATWQDEDRIYDFLVKLHKFNLNGWGHSYRPEIVFKQIQAGTRPDPATRADPRDQRRGMIGIIEGDKGEVAASIGIYLMEPTWFTNDVIPTELWVFVLPEYRRRHYDKPLFEFAVWFKDSMKELLGPDHRSPWYLNSGFMNQSGSERGFEVLDRLWRMRTRGRKIGSLYRVD